MMTIRESKQKLVILGTGWGGYSMLKSVKPKYYDITVISPRNHFLFTPLLTSTTVGTLEFRSIIEPIRNSGPNRMKDFHLAEAIGLDTKTNSVQCRSIIRPDHEYQLRYDKLVIGVGMLPSTFGVKGVYEHACFLKEIADARKIRHRLLMNIERSQSAEISEEERKRLLHIVTVGGGPTGVEFDAELYDFIEQDVSRFYHQDKNDIKVTLIEARQILPSFDKRLQTYAEKKFCERANFQLIQSSVSEVKSDGVVLHDGTFIACGLVVWSTGLQAREFTKSLPAAMKNERGQILVDERLRVLADSSGNSYAIGDCSSVIGQSLPCTAQVAEREGRYLAQQLNFECTNETSEPYPPFKFQSMGMLAYIGDRKALSDLPQFKAKGFLSWLFWRSAYFARLGSWRLRMQVPLDWMKTRIFGRDTATFD